MAKRKSNGSKSNGYTINNCHEAPQNSYYKNGIVITALNQRQKEALKSIRENDLTFLIGCAGTSKTHLSVLYGVSELLKGNFRTIVFSRPCVEADGEELGFLPGSFNEKISPYMIPIFDILYTYVEPKVIDALFLDRHIITLPLAFMRGVSFNNAYVILDEAQNTHPKQMRMFLTRMGNGSKVVVTGDLAQSDISGINGLKDAYTRFEGIKGVHIVQFEEEHIIRHPLVARIESRYQNDN